VVRPAGDFDWTPTALCVTVNPLTQPQWELANRSLQTISVSASVTNPAVPAALLPLWVRPLLMGTPRQAINMLLVALPHGLSCDGDADAAALSVLRAAGLLSRLVVRFLCRHMGYVSACLPSHGSPQRLAWVAHCQVMGVVMQHAVSTLATSLHVVHARMCVPTGTVASEASPWPMSPLARVRAHSVFVHGLVAVLNDMAPLASLLPTATRPFLTLLVHVLDTLKRAADREETSGTWDSVLADVSVLLPRLMCAVTRVHALDVWHL
jgi:hypothetical protein